MEKDEETIPLTRQKKQSAAFTKRPAVLAALQHCACSSISRGTIRKLGCGKIKGNVETNLPSFDLSRLSFSSTSCTPFLSLPCLLFALDLDPRRRWRRHVDWRDFYAAFVKGGGGEGNLSSFGFQTSAKNVKNNLSFGFFWWIKIIGDVFSRLLIFQNWKFSDHLFWGGGEGISFDTWRQMKRYHRWNFCTRIATWIRIFIYNFTKHRIKYILNIDFLIWIGLHLRHWSEFNNNKWKYYF